MVIGLFQTGVTNTQAKQVAAVHHILERDTLGKLVLAR